MRTLAQRARLTASVARNNFLSDRDLRTATSRLGAAPTSPRPLVLVHGWIARKPCWLSTIDALAQRGLDHLHAASYNVWTDDVAAATERVADRLQIAVANHPQQPIDVLAHSMGGLLTLRAVLSRPHLAAHIGQVATLGTPYAGARLARYARLAPYGPLRSAAQMAPGHQPLATLIDRALDDLNLPWTCIWSTADELVPAASARALNGPTVRHVRLDRPVGHIEMLASNAVADVIAATLTPPAATAAA